MSRRLSAEAPTRQSAIPPIEDREKEFYHGDHGGGTEDTEKKQDGFLVKGRRGEESGAGGKGI